MIVICLFKNNYQKNDNDLNVIQFLKWQKKSNNLRQMLRKSSPQRTKIENFFFQNSNMTNFAKICPPIQFFTPINQKFVKL